MTVQSLKLTKLGVCTGLVGRTSSVFSKINLGLFRPISGHNGHSSSCSLLAWGNILILFLLGNELVLPLSPKDSKIQEGSSSLY